MTTPWYLVGSSGPSSGSSFELLGPSITVGRVADNDIVVDDNMVSRHHARLEMRGDAYILTDLGSANGTWVNGRRISEPVTLQANDSIRFGKQSGFIFSARPFLGGDETFVTEDMAPKRPPTPPAAPVPPRPAAGGGTVCAACGKPNRPGVRFCGHCGQPMRVTQAPRRRSGLPGWVLAVGCGLAILVVVLVAALVVFLVLPSRVKPTPSVDVKPTLPPMTAIPLDPTPSPAEALAPTFTPVLPEPPLYPPPSGKFVFATNRDNPSDTSGYHTRSGEAVADKDLYLMNADGSGLVRLTDEARDDANPRWSPDAQRIVFVSSRDGNFNVFVMNADGSAAARLTDDPARDLDPTWSPDGQRIAFCSDRDGNQEIYVMNADGSGQIRITNNPATDYIPDWSPDGEWIAFGSSRDGNEDIYLMRPDGSQVTKLTQDPATDYHPSWSPDGKRIVFSSKRDGNFEVYVMKADGSDPVRLTDDPAGDMAPRWSPDGNYIKFHREVDGNWEIFIMRADGSEQRNITNDPARDTDADWAAGSVPPTLTPIPPTPTPGAWVQVIETAKAGPPIFGPDSGKLVHEEKGFVISQSAEEVDLRDFVVEAVFYNPYPTTRGDWDIGFLFRDIGTAEELRLAVDSSGDWELRDRRGDDSNLVEKGRLSNLDTRDSGSNWLVLAADGERGFFFVNGTFVAELDLSSRTESGKVLVATGIETGRAIEGEVTTYDGFTVWPLTPQAEQVIVVVATDTPIAPMPPPTPTRKPAGVGQIAFVSNRDGNDEIYVMNPDGSNQRRFTNTPGEDWHPDWSPDGSRILFACYREGNFNACVVNADGSGYTQLTYLPASVGQVYRPVWSPDGQRFAFTRELGGAQTLITAGADGKDHREVADLATQPHWSPDGSKIAFIRYRDGGLQIWTVSPDGSDERMLTQGNHNHMYPTWSPDGSQIAFEYDHVHVAIMDAGGGPPRIVADKGSHNLDWSPDGNKLVISPPGEGIWVVNVDGSGLTQIAQEGKLPSWQALP